MGLYKKESSPFYYMCFNVAGRQYHRSTGTDNKKLAMAILGKVLSQIEPRRATHPDRTGGAAHRHEGRGGT